MNSERAQDVADVRADGRNRHAERCGDLTGILAVAEQLEDLPLSRRQLLHLPRGRMLHLPRGPRRQVGRLRAQEMQKLRVAAGAGGDRRDGDAATSRGRPHEQRLRRARSPLQRLACEGTAGVAYDRAVLGDTREHPPARLANRLLRGDARQLLDRCVPRHDPQPLVENEQRIPRDVLRRLPHARGYAAGAAFGSCEVTAAAAAEFVAGCGCKRFAARATLRGMKVCVVGASGKLGQYMVQHALDRGYDVVGVCREKSVGKLDRYKGRITIVAGPTDDAEVIRRAVAGCDGVLVVLVPWGMHHYASGTAQAVLDSAPAGARLVFSCGWHIRRDGQDVFRWTLKDRALAWAARTARLVDIDDQVEATRRIFASDTLWTVVRGSDLEEGESQGLPVWSRHVGDPILESNITRRTDFALFMVEALTNNDLIHEAPAIVGCQTPSALRDAARVGR